MAETAAGYPRFCAAPLASEDEQRTRRVRVLFAWCSGVLFRLAGSGQRDKLTKGNSLRRWAEPLSRCKALPCAEQGRFATVDLSSVSHGKREGLRPGEKLNKGHCPLCGWNAPFGHNHTHARRNTPSPLGLSRQTAQGALHPALIPIALVPSPCDCLRLCYGAARGRC